MESEDSGSKHLVKNNNSLDCPDPWSDPDTAKLLATFCFWMGGVVLCSVGIIGIFGNVANIMIFSQRSMRSTFHVFLIILSVGDLGYLIICVLDSALRLDYRVLSDPTIFPRQAWVFLYPKFLYPMKQIFLTVSTYMTVVICVNRYLCIVHPLKFATKCTPCETLSKVDSKRVFYSSMPVFIFAILYSVPHFFEYKIAYDNVSGLPMVEWTELRRNHYYSEIYTIAVDFIVRLAIPVLVTVFTSSRIFCILRKTRDVNGSDMHFAMTMVAIVMVFITGQSGKIIVNVHNFIIHETLSACKEIHPSLGAPAWDIMMTDIARVLLLLNSSFNIIVYCYTCPNFAIKLMNSLKCQCDRVRTQSLSIISEDLVEKLFSGTTWSVIFGRKGSHDFSHHI